MKNLSFLGCSQYTVDKFGNVFSNYSKKYLKHGYDKDGYHKLTLTADDGSLRYYRVHRLVAAAFCDNYDESLVVNHKDGDVSNNFYRNLEWVTISENTAHSFANGFQKVTGGNAVTTPEKVHTICQLLEAGLVPEEISSTVEVPVSVVDGILSKKYWGYISKEYNIEYTSDRPHTKSGNVTLPETVHSVCRLLEQGVRPKEISIITEVDVRKIGEIRNKTFWKYISDEYNIDYVKKKDRIEMSKVRSICEMLQDGATLTLAANTFNVGISTVHRIKKRSTYTDISSSYTW